MGDGRGGKLATICPMCGGKMEPGLRTRVQMFWEYGGSARLHGSSGRIVCRECAFVIAELAQTGVPEKVRE